MSIYEVPTYENGQLYYVQLIAPDIDIALDAFCAAGFTMWSEYYRENGQVKRLMELA